MLLTTCRQSSLWHGNFRFPFASAILTAFASFFSALFLAFSSLFSFADFLKLIDKNEFSYLWLRIVSPFSDFFVSITFFGNTYLSFLSSLFSPSSSLILSKLFFFSLRSSLIVSNLSSLKSRIVFMSIVLLSDIIVILQRKSFF